MRVAEFFNHVHSKQTGRFAPAVNSIRTSVGMITNSAIHAPFKGLTHLRKATVRFIPDHALARLLETAQGSARAVVKGEMGRRGLSYADVMRSEAYAAQVREMRE